MCQMESVGYSIFCMECKNHGNVAVMDGETGRTGHMRCEEHISALDSKNRPSNLREHCQLVHNGRRIEFACEVVCRLQTCLLYASPMWHIGLGPMRYIGPGPISTMGPHLFNT